MKAGTPEILDRGAYAAAYNVLTGSTIILACPNGLCRKNHGNVSLMTPFMTRESGWDVRDVAPHHCSEYRDPNLNCLILKKSGDQSYIKLDLELLNNQPSLQIFRPTAEEINDLPWYELTSLAGWNPYSPFYDENEHTANLRRKCWGGQTMTFRTANCVSIILKHLLSKEDPRYPVHYIH